MSFSCIWICRATVSVIAVSRAFSDSSRSAASATTSLARWTSFLLESPFLSSSS